jgi:hypothetical protein
MGSVEVRPSNGEVKIVQTNELSEREKELAAFALSLISTDEVRSVEEGGTVALASDVNLNDLRYVLGGAALEHTLVY